MTKLVLYNTSSGAILGFYDTLDSPPPGTLPSGTATLAITNTQWQTCLATPGYTVSGGVLVAPSSTAQLIAAQVQQIGLLNSGYAATVNGTFTSAATGTTRTYPTDPTSVSLMIASATYSLTATGSSSGEFGIWCETSGSWNWVYHTPAQIQLLALDWSSFVQIQQSTLQTLISNVNSSSTVSQVQSNVWP